MRLKDRVAIVTGGGSGIGRAISERFALEGANVIIAARNIERLEEAVKEINSKGGKAKAIKTDITDQRQIQQMVSQTMDEFGKIDVLVNNAAAMGAPSIEVVDMDLNVWNAAFNTNLTGTMMCSGEVLKAMIPRKSGSIINISSIGGMSGLGGKSPYCVTKWGIIGLTETLAIEAGKHNIRVNSISPAATHSQEFEENTKRIAKQKNIPYEELWNKIVSNNALMRIAQPSEVAACALFLASDDSTAVTSHNLVVSCGFHLTHPSDIK